jgi:hypothetical protein
VRRSARVGSSAYGTDNGQAIGTSVQHICSIA